MQQVIGSAGRRGAANKKRLSAGIVRRMRLKCRRVNGFNFKQTFKEGSKMGKRRFLELSVVLVVSVILAGCGGRECRESNKQACCVQKTIEPTKKIMLWNGKDFDGWKLFAADPNVDVRNVWSVKNGVIRCEGKPNGYMRTKSDYAKYKLHVEWRWPGSAGNSGVFVHMSKPDRIWPRAVECQLQSGSAGDFWFIDGTDSPGSEKKILNVKKKTESSEKQLGEWNSYDIYCRGNNVRIFVNGVLQNEAKETAVGSGKICLQSEGTPIEFRNIYIEPL